MISAGSRGPEQGIAEGAGLHRSSSSHRARTLRRRWPANPPIGWRNSCARSALARIFRIARLVAIEPVDAAERIVPGDGEADLPRFARRALASGARACRARADGTCFGRRAGFRIAPLAQRAGPRKFAPIEAKAVEPLAAQVIVDMLDAVAVGRDREIAALGCRSAQVGRSEMQRAQSPGAGEGVHAAVAAIVSERARRSCSRSGRRCRSRLSKENSAAGIDESRSLCGMNGLNAVIRTLPGKRSRWNSSFGHRKPPDKC